MISTGPASLKEFAVFDLAKPLNLSALAIYERQRALVRLRVLPAESRGRNRGVRATPETVSPLLLAVLFADSLSEIDERFVTLLNAKPNEMENRLAGHAEKQAHLDSAARQWTASGKKTLARDLVKARKEMVEPRKMVCPITGAVNFRNAVAAVLSSKELSGRISSIAINRWELVGSISTVDQVSQFGTAKKSQPLRMEVVAHIPGDLVRQISTNLYAENDHKEQSS